MEATDGKAGLVRVTRGALLKHGGHCLPPRNLGDADLMDQEIAQGSALLSKAPQGILRCGQGRGALVHRVPRGTGCRPQILMSVWAALGSGGVPRCARPGWLLLWLPRGGGPLPR